MKSTMIESLSFRASAVVLIVANLVPLIGVLWLDWQVLDVVLLYWVENVIIGAINVLRMLVCPSKRNFFLIPFFAFHYGFFCYGHLLAIMTLFGGPEEILAMWHKYFAMSFDEALRSPVWIGIAAISASHLFSFFVNFIGTGEYRRTTAEKLMQRPYGRILILQIAILLGAIIIQWLGLPLGMLIALVGVKIFMDLKLHLAERDTFATKDPVLLQERHT